MFYPASSIVKCEKVGNRLNNILILSRTMAEHWSLFRAPLKCARRARLSASLQRQRPGIVIDRCDIRQTSTVNELLELPRYPPVLAPRDENKSFRLYMDFSETGAGAVLAQIIAMVTKVLAYGTHRR